MTRTEKQSPWHTEDDPALALALLEIRKAYGEQPGLVNGGHDEQIILMVQAMGACSTAMLRMASELTDVAPFTAISTMTLVRENIEHLLNSINGPSAMTKIREEMARIKAAEAAGKFDLKGADHV